MLDFSVGHFIPVSRLGMVPSCRTKTRTFNQNRIRQWSRWFYVDVWIVSWMGVLLEGWPPGLMGGLVDGWIEGYGAETLPLMRLGSIFGILPDAILSNHATFKNHLPVKNG